MKKLISAVHIIGCISWSLACTKLTDSLFLGFCIFLTGVCLLFMVFTITMILILMISKEEK